MKKILRSWGKAAIEGTVVPVLGLLLIVAVSAHAEKPSPFPQWEGLIEQQRKSFDRFEFELDSWRFDFRQATSPISYEQAEAFLAEMPALIEKYTASGDSEEELIPFLVGQSHRIFGTMMEVIEVRSEIHQRDATQGSYRVWDRPSGSLSYFDRRGSWHQDANEVSLGPMPSLREIEIYLSRLGLFVPTSATAELVLDATPSGDDKALEYVMDWEGERFWFYCRPWNGTALVDEVREGVVYEGKEQGLLEKRLWYAAPTVPSGTAPVPFKPTAPIVGIQVQYHADTAIDTLAIYRVSGLRFDPNDWTDLPEQRPPFGWPILDYRFRPETEFRFGELGHY